MFDPMFTCFHTSTEGLVLVEDSRLQCVVSGAKHGYGLGQCSEAFAAAVMHSTVPEPLAGLGDGDDARQNTTNAHTHPPYSTPLLPISALTLLSTWLHV